MCLPTPPVFAPQVPLGHPLQAHTPRTTRPGNQISGPVACGVREPSEGSAQEASVWAVAHDRRCLEVPASKRGPLLEAAVATTCCDHWPPVACTSLTAGRRLPAPQLHTNQLPPGSHMRTCSHIPCSRHARISRKQRTPTSSLLPRWRRRQPPLAAPTLRARSSNEQFGTDYASCWYPSRPRVCVCQHAGAR